MDSIGVHEIKSKVREVLADPHVDRDEKAHVIVQRLEGAGLSAVSVAVSPVRGIHAAVVEIGRGTMVIEL